MNDRELEQVEIDKKRWEATFAYLPKIHDVLATMLIILFVMTCLLGYIAYKLT